MLVFDGDGLSSAHDPTVIRRDERVEVAVRENRVNIARLTASAQILDHLIGVQNVAPDLVAKANVVLGPAQLVERLGTLLQLELIELGAEKQKANLTY